ncbi:uncharacterized protein J4E78_003349 [Alternaria triticimaculans]|uniref:uncharacterized protein n=1 Tax=Alternaria triticimaculans TaxID=297637 RepID=UPI0020C52ADF|nr:uncharacterized protein J4E78_003349 [Alternaria triticimaculans]KAI4665884.1 hypothetical protein J4E78_003349 [Alternaria triticimaculans]
MATTDIASSHLAAELSEPSPAVQGQSMSKSARTRRNRAAKKAALLKDVNTTASSTEQAGSPESADTTKKVIPDEDEDLTVKAVSIADTDGSATASLPKEPLPTKINLQPATNPGSDHKPTTPSFSPVSEVADVPPQPKTAVKQSAQSPSSPVIDQSIDNLLEMIRAQRQALLQGPRITIHIGDTSVEGISKRAAMAASTVLQKHFTANPQSHEYVFSRGQIHPGAVRLLLIGWMQETCNEFEAYAVPAQKTFGEDAALLRAARLLGMERYCSHIHAGYVEYLKTQLPSYEEIITVEQNAMSDKDPLWTAMVNHLCHDRYKRLIPDPEDFAAFLEKHTRLRKAMESADIFFAGMAKRQVEGREQEREKERRQRWEHNQAEKHARIAKERLAAESLRKKMDEKGSGLMTVTAEEAELLRGRTRTR